MQPTFTPPVRATPGAWHVTPGTSYGVDAKGTGPRYCKASEPYGVTPVPRGRGARWSSTRSNPPTLDGRMTVERTSVFPRPLLPSRGGAEPKASVVGASRSRGTSHPVLVGNAEGATVLITRLRARQRGARSVRGGDSASSKDGTGLHSGRPVHGNVRIARCVADRVARRSRRSRRSRPRTNVGGATRRPPPRTRIRRPGVGARTSSYCRSCEVVFGLGEARPRSRTGRKPVRGQGRADEGLTSSGCQSAQATRTTRGKRGTIRSGSGHPQSRERRTPLNALGLVRASAPTSARVPYDGRHLGSATRSPFTRPPRNRSWRPSRSPPRSHCDPEERESRRRRQGCQRRVDRRAGGRKRRT
jgi:hypothetical protein